MSLQRQPAADEPSGRDSRSWVSAAVDGDADALARACTDWRGDAQTRATWHTYHLIGDVMRSSELAAAPARDEAFLAALRGRLAAEPVVLAPQPLQPAPARRQALNWRMPVAVAAGFAVVAGVLVVSRLSTAPEAGGPALASASSPAGAGLQAVGAPSVDNGVIRDARLDEYLRAHQAARGAIGVPGGGLRRADVELPPGAPR